MKKGDKIKCVDNGGYSTSLTVDKTYTVESTYDDMVTVRCDDGSMYGFCQRRFELVEKTNMKKGDKIKCVNPTTSLTLNKVYEVLDVDYDYDPYVTNDNGFREMYCSYRFEVVSGVPTLEEQAKDALSLLGKKVMHGTTTLVVESITIYGVSNKPPYTNPIVNGYYDKHGFCVVIKGGRYAVPVDGVTLVPESKTIELTNEYDAEVFKNEVKVGCQTISIEKVKEILTIAESL